jgi:hypothetical protein
VAAALASSAAEVEPTDAIYDTSGGTVSLVYEHTLPLGQTVPNNTAWISRGSSRFWLNNGLTDDTETLFFDTLVLRDHVVVPEGITWPGPTGLVDSLGNSLAALDTFPYTT